MTIQVGTDTVFHTPHDVLQSALADSVLFLEKATVGRAQISDISDSLAEYKRLFSVKLASPAEILTLSRAFPDNQKFAKAAEKIEDDKMPVVVGGPASVEMVDREGHLITTDALTKAFDKYMDNFRTRNVMVMHSDVQVGHALPAYITKGGSVFRSGVDPRGLFFITELRNDTRIAAKVKEQIESGKMRSYSIAGNATESKDIHKEDGTKIMQVNNLELAEVTICEKGVNQGAHFDLMKGMILDKEESTPTPVRSNDLLLEETLSKGVFNAFKIEESLNKSTPLLGMFQDFMGKEKKHSTDTPLGNQTVHPDHKGEEERRKQLARVQEEFGLPEETAGSEYNRYAPVDYKHPHSFTSARVVNQSGQDLASAQIGEHPVEDTVERLKALRKAGPIDRLTGGRVKFERDPQKQTGPSAGKGGWQMQTTGPPGSLQHKLNQALSGGGTKQTPSTAKDQTKRNVESAGLEYASKMQKTNSIDKVLSKLFQKAGKDKEDRTPGNSPTPNEFPADTSTSPYQSKGLFEKQHGDTADIDRSTIRQRAEQEARRGAADIPPEDPEFEYESSPNPYDDRIDTDAQAYYKRREAREKQAEQGGEGWTRGKTPRTGKLEGHTPIVDPRPKYPTPQEAETGMSRSRGISHDKARNIGRPGAIGQTPGIISGSARTGTTNRGVRQAGSRSTGSRGVEEQTPRYKNIDRSTIRGRTPTQETDYAPPALKNSMQKQVRSEQGTSARTPGMSQQRSEQGPTTAWGDPTRAAKPTMRQQMPWDEKSLEKNEGQSNPRLDPTKVKGSPSDPNAPEVLDAAARNRKRVAETAGKPAVTPYRTLPSGERGEREEKSLQKNENPIYRKPSQRPSLESPKVPTHDEAGAAASRARVEAGKDEPQVSPRPYPPSRDAATHIMDREIKRKKAGWRGFPSSRSEKSLSKANPDPVEEGKAILAMPFNLATQMIMGKKSPNSVSADDRLKESVLILLKQQASAEEVGASLLGGGDWDPFSAAAKGAAKGAGKLLGGAKKTPASAEPTQPAATDPSSQRMGGNDFGQEVTPAGSTPTAAKPQSSPADAKSATEAAGLEYASKMTKSNTSKKGKTTNLEKVVDVTTLNSGSPARGFSSNVTVRTKPTRAGGLSNRGQEESSTNM